MSSIKSYSFHIQRVEISEGTPTEKFYLRHLVKVQFDLHNRLTRYMKIPGTDDRIRLSVQNQMVETRVVEQLLPSIMFLYRDPSMDDALTSMGIPEFHQLTATISIISEVKQLLETRGNRDWSCTNISIWVRVQADETQESAYNEHVAARIMMMESARQQQCKPKPASIDSIEASLKKVRLAPRRPDPMGSAGLHGVLCGVCLEEFEFDIEADQMPCDHVFHPHCIRKWLQISGVCPLCRHEIKLA